MKSPWYNYTTEKALIKLETQIQGLTALEASERLREHGLNILPETKTDSLFVIFLRQFQSPLIYILIVAGILVFWIGETTDAGIIFAVLFFNAIVGAIQEGKAQNAMRALKKFAETSATVVRDGEEIVVSDREIVPGDILLIREGERVPADARLLTLAQFAVDESAFTGESEPVEKTTEALSKEDLPTADQRNMAFRGTFVVRGSGTAVAVATGTATVIGEISKEIATLDTEIPLKTNVRFLSRAIIVIICFIVTALFTLGIATGKGAQEMFLTVVTLAVSIIPEGLPIVLTLVLATGVWRMSKRQALVKKLQAVEALGQTKVIAVDKTGTITTNEMVVQDVYLSGKLFKVKGSGYESTGQVFLGRVPVSSKDHPELGVIARISALASSAHVQKSEADGQYRVFGDPTEAALSVFAQKLGVEKVPLELVSPRLFDAPFEYANKYHAFIHKIDRHPTLMVVGAAEVVLALCSTELHNGNPKPLDSGAREVITKQIEQLSREGKRVMACAQKEVMSAHIPKKMRALSFVGLIAMRDTLRPSVRASVGAARTAGMRVVMITGDHRNTAETIAAEAGIFRRGDHLLSGEELETMSGAELEKALASVSVFARVTPEHKLRIIEAYRARGEIIAMTGDGVNDAPSLVAADLGVAMGHIGTEVAKEAADIVLLDDNFSSIVAAIEEGRSIYKTIKKVILYLFSTSIGEMLTIAGALLMGLPLPILPGQIIWLNFVTDGFLDVALAMEPKEKGLLRGHFERPAKYLVDRLMLVRMAVMATPMALGTLAIFVFYLGHDAAKAGTVTLTTLAVFQWFNAWNARHERHSIFKMQFLSNLFLVGATGIVIFLQLLAVYEPWLQRILHTVPLSPTDWLLIISTGLTIVVAEEWRKVMYAKL